MSQRREPHFERLGDAAPDDGPATFVVLGSARGGTSMVAGLLRLLEVPMGEELDPGNNEDREFLFHRGSRRLLDDEATRGECIERLLDVVRRRNAAHGVWGWKDPLAYLYVRDLLPELRAPRLVLITRDPLAVGLNQHRHRRADVLEQTRVALETYRDLLDLARSGVAPCLCAGYESVLRHPDEFVDTLSRFTGRSLDDRERIRAVAFVRPARGHANLQDLDSDLRRLAETAAAADGR
jgi:hypothetical protein